MTSTHPLRRQGAAAVAGCLVLLLALFGCSAFGGADAPPEAHVENLVVDGQAALALVPGKTQPRGLVIYLHGFGGNHESLQSADQAGIADRLVADGYVVAASDAHFDAFGNAESQQAYVDLARELRDRYSTSRTFLLAESMGTVAALQIVAHDQIPDLVGMVAISGLTDLDTVAGTEFEPLLRQAYGGRLPTGAENPARLSASAFAGTRLRFYVTEGDDLVVSAENATPFVTKVQGVADVSVVQCTGGHVDASCFQPDDIADWLEALSP